MKDWGFSELKGTRGVSSFSGHTPRKKGNDGEELTMGGVKIPLKEKDLKWQRRLQKKGGTFRLQLVHRGGKKSIGRLRKKKMAIEGETKRRKNRKAGKGIFSDGKTKKGGKSKTGYRMGI